MTDRTIAALFVDENGCYANFPDIDTWGINRDARKYPGPFPVVAHPPCQRWGAFWRGGIYTGPSRFQKGDDGGCFAATLEFVRKYGGVLEHPRSSAAWEWFGLNRPPISGGWIIADTWGGYTCCVEQGHYGHPARKATMLYAVGCELPVFKWGPCEADFVVGKAVKNKFKRALFDGEYKPKLRRNVMNKQSDREATPTAFRDILIAMARSVGSVQVPTQFAFMESFADHVEALS